MRYILSNGQYDFKYREVKDEYIRFCEMSDRQFLMNLPAALHLACFICWVKDEPTREILSDEGLIHELAHLFHIPHEAELDLTAIRELFKKTLELA
ncbi:MAG: hypothetical protein WC756_12185 [Taibaiella sp.]|jgi:hypothetical protein